VRGASAIQQLLAERPTAPVRVIAVWEPVIATDIGPPLSRVLRLLDDRRAVQLWDPDRTLEADIRRSIDLAPARYGYDGPLPRDLVIWDVVAVFGPGARWESDLPVPAYHGGPVVEVLDATAAALDRELGAAQPAP
jgi:hypothetical protein